MSLSRDFSVSALTAGFLAVLISYSGPLLIFFQAGQSAGVSPAMMASWVWGISIGAAISGIVLSWWLRVPVVTAWSAPGTALLITLFPDINIHQAVGAYLVAGAILLAIGLSGSFDWLMQRIPKGIAFGMMAGILFQFGTGAFQPAASMPLLTFGMVLAYLLWKRFFPRYFLVLVLLTGVALSAISTGGLAVGEMDLSPTWPIFIAPEWHSGAILSLALPLVLVSLTGQFLPGMAILRGAGYSTPAKPIVAITSLASLSVAMVGGISIVIAAITAALCTGKEAHDDPSKRYVAGIANGAFYLVGGCFSGAIIGLFAALPSAFIAVLAGLALLGAIAANLAGTLAEADQREAAVITFVATASGMSWLGLGSAFWGIVIGLVAHFLLRPRSRP
ncbi:benzoate/H(+) symporter BenE family transporter [Comamonas nitrativorans]|uniref:Benzoate/H(+) symporter BenE family transporter n=1 Tax=Comamonas nitrativorans TaxID=108437 RepID=A0ABV9H1T5_9BURK